MNGTFADFRLTSSSQGLMARNTKGDCLHIDFSSRTFLHRLQNAGLKNEIIAKAIGLKHQRQPQVIDATAGFGYDAFLLAHLGCRMVLLERCELMAALLADALARAAQHPNLADTASNIRLHHISGHEYLSHLSAEQRPDVIYLDPMYPERSKSALGKKRLRLLHEVVGFDRDADALFELALPLAQRRVVVKRPKLAPALSTRPLTHCFKIGSSRFDVYATNA